MIPRDLCIFLPGVQVVAHSLTSVPFEPRQVLLPGKSGKLQIRRRDWVAGGQVEGQAGRQGSHSLHERSMKESKPK